MAVEAWSVSSAGVESRTWQWLASALATASVSPPSAVPSFQSLFQRLRPPSLSLPSSYC